MCGRLNISKSKVDKWVIDHLGIPFLTSTNTDLSPSQPIDTLTLVSGSLQQLKTTWGIKPNWSKQLIINAQGETVTIKKTFQKAFTTNRCLVPCSGWYEWKSEGGPKKQKYLFSHADETPFFMAGIWFQHEDSAQLVTLTTHPNERCATIHKRMPVLILPEDMDYWFNANAEEVAPLIDPIDSNRITITRC